MKLKEYQVFRDATSRTLFSGLRVKTTSGYKGWLHSVTSKVATLTTGRCSPEGTCPLKFINGVELEEIGDWEVLNIDGKPIK
jgi:hypothetical protein